MLLKLSAASHSPFRCSDPFLSSSTWSLRHLSVAGTPRLVLRVASCSSAASPVPQEVGKTINGGVFEPFLEVPNQLVKIPSTSTESFARQSYTSACEAAINTQIKYTRDLIRIEREREREREILLFYSVEYNVSYVYHNLFAFFDRDNVGLPGFAKLFKESSEEEKAHAENLMKYQNMRGGKVKLQQILAPPITEFDNEEKGDALNAMELALAMEKLVNEKLLQLHKVAEEAGDAQLQDFIEGEFLKPQLEDIKKVSEYVSQLRRVGTGHGVYHFDRVLQGEEEA